MLLTSGRGGRDGVGPGIENVPGELELPSVC